MSRSARAEASVASDPTRKWCGDRPAANTSAAPCGDQFHYGSVTMKTLAKICIIGLFALTVMSSRGVAQTASTAETRLEQLNITLPPVPPPIANYVDSVRVGNLLFLAGNTAGPAWKYKGKVGKELTVQEGYDTARQVGLIM